MVAGKVFMDEEIGREFDYMALDFEVVVFVILLGGLFFKERDG